LGAGWCNSACSKRQQRLSDLGWVFYTKCKRDIGISIERIIEYISLFKQGDDTISRRKEILVDQRDELAEKLDILNKTYD
jgi:DNA-binding transcriptional MerR regulator